MIISPPTTSTTIKPKFYQHFNLGKNNNHLLKPISNQLKPVDEVMIDGMKKMKDKSVNSVPGSTLNYENYPINPIELTNSDDKIKNQSADIPKIANQQSFKPLIKLTDIYLPLPMPPRNDFITPLAPPPIASPLTTPTQTPTTQSPISPSTYQWQTTKLNYHRYRNTVTTVKPTTMKPTTTTSTASPSAIEPPYYEYDYENEPKLINANTGNANTFTADQGNANFGNANTVNANSGNANFGSTNSGNVNRGNSNLGKTEYVNTESSTELPTFSYDNYNEDDLTSRHSSPMSTMAPVTATDLSSSSSSATRSSVSSSSPNYYYYDYEYDDNVIANQSSDSSRMSTTTMTTTTTRRSLPSTPRRAKVLSFLSAARKPRPTNRRLVIKERASQSLKPASRPSSVHPTPKPLRVASKCDPKKCKIPDCNCGSSDIPKGKIKLN